MTESVDARRRFYRVMLNVALAGWFYVIGFWLGPNELTFHKLEGMTTADFAPIVEKYCVPAVREIKIYRRDHGHLPESEGDMWSLFGNQNDHGPGVHRLNRDGGYEYWGPGEVMFKHTIIYDFTSGHEGWAVEGPYANGPIPVPQVTLEPATEPAPRK
jgi:hypothetical protein